MSDSIWIVGQSLEYREDGSVIWRKLGTFVDQRMAESWRGYTGADILIEQTQSDGSVLPSFSEVAISVFPPSLACDCHEHAFCTCHKQEDGACH